MSTLYIIATPIGNLEDVTLRAIRILKEVDLILCEDTRVTRKFLNHYEIQTSVESYHSHSRGPKVEKILEFLKSGKTLALVTDAGTPGISDPGSELIALARNALPDVAVVPIPGPSALTAALSASGLATDQFVFFGFLPHKKGRETLIKKIAENEMTSVVYESPHRILKLLQAFEKFLPDRTVVVARELTKMFEEIKTGTATELLVYYSENPDKVRGEFVVIIAGR